MTKRRRLLIEAALLSLGLLGIQSVDISYRYLVILFLGIAAYFLTAFSLKEDLKKKSFLMNLPLPALYTMGVALFYFLLPEVFLSRLFILIFFGIGMYALLLIENIFTIATEKTIQLLRAARAVGFLMTLVTAFLFYDTLFSFRLPSYINSLGVFSLSFLLILPSLWTISLSDRLGRRLIDYSLVLSLVMGQLALFISFWPLSIAAVSLFLVTSLYVILGISQNFLSGRLFKNTMAEYLRVGIIVFIITFFLASWG